MSEPSTVSLSDGRTLSYEEYGRTDGRPVFCFHGNPGSRLMWSLLDETAQRRDVRLLAPDRPGFGQSDFLADRTLLDWAEDVTVLADDVGVDRFGVLGFSAGGPHALACASALPDRVGSTVLVSSAAPPATHGHASAFGQGLFAAMRSVPGFSRGMFTATGWLARNWRQQFEGTIKQTLSNPDRELFRDPAGDVLVTDAVAAFEDGGRGPAYEFDLLGGDWGFDLSDLASPATLWHGSADVHVDVDMARAFAELLTDAELTLVDLGHYSTLVENDAAILDDAAPDPA